MEIISEKLLGIEVRVILLIKSDTWLKGMYRGNTFIGMYWDFKEDDVSLLFQAGNKLFPKNLKDWEAYEKIYSNRVDYFPRKLKDHFCLPTDKLEQYRAR
ncbi:hypothetical protein G1K66_08440 [Tenacibaculum finnmarkense]|uniref:Uncharacterized protein n=1 Tax=Tenacibaculum finnmarkense genomovar ulcerans TaxID=2781388 RepID=A0A2I2MBN9_9FLAO|nr:hypothetical protein [Tenacibaculum finnmarkense]MBE7688437.1 hypothetical protein [Tenacibaculum finnmarkense genomovar ulcerans]MCD8431016.1 hypothetical protein [Tenacibaculum finnmarkense genomovar ulcerans]MCG8813288.1 hypothetical protein [Tenacibaculum finnmarkense]SOU89460.1 hypothetical protein TNO010_400035 [Tenacibaculum finnmarkense genomovar ulcerans]